MFTSSNVPVKIKMTRELKILRASGSSGRLKDEIKCEIMGCCPISEYIL
jgi:hypothetical protein